MTTTTEVTNVSEHGFWLLVDGEEHFLPFDEFPWFRAATIEQIRNVERPRDRHFHWPQLDVDLSLDSIRNPERYPLRSRGGGKDMAATATKRRS